MSSNKEDPPGRPGNDNDNDPAATGGAVVEWVKSLFRPKTDSENLREALEEYIEELDHNGVQESVASHERSLLSNILEMRDLTVVDVMIPRADIAALEVDTSQKDLMALLAERQFSRFPVFRGTLDEIVGTIHIKDLLSHLALGKEINLRSLVREVPIVSPAMPVFDLLLMMKQSKKHMALVVDEFGGIDGLVTIGDVIEAIVGEVDDEFDTESTPQIFEKPDGTLIADARMDIESFEERFGRILDEEEREDIDTLGGLVFAIAGRVPARGEVLKHDSGVIFEILDADPRRVTRLRIKNIPAPASQD